MENYCYFLIVVTSILLGCCVKLKIEKKQDLDFGKHFKPKQHFLFEHCSKCGKRLKHYHWFLGKGDFMGCEVDYSGNTKWFCEECENELNKNVLHRIPKKSEIARQNRQTIVKSLNLTKWTLFLKLTDINRESQDKTSQKKRFLNK